MLITVCCIESKKNLSYSLPEFYTKIFSLICFFENDLIFLNKSKWNSLSHLKVKNIQ